MESKRQRRILEILDEERFVKMKRLAAEFNVSVRSIQHDIDELTVNYPIKTIRGRNGGVKLEDWYHLHRDTLKHRHQNSLLRMITEADEPNKSELTDMLVTYGSLPFIRQLPGKELFS